VCVCMCQIASPDEVNCNVHEMLVIMDTERYNLFSTFSIFKENTRGSLKSKKYIYVYIYIYIYIYVYIYIFFI